MFKKTIELFLLDGNPSDRIMCTVSNWDGKAYKIPKTKIKESSDREELKYTGFYFLFDRDEENKYIYVGEAENVFDRLRNHLDEDTWNEALVFIKKDNTLNKAHVKFLENYFYNLAKKIDRYKVINKNIPTKSSISETDTATMEEFSNYVKLVTSTLGYKAFEDIIDKHNHKDYFYINSKGLIAKGKMTNEGFVVVKGSNSSIDFKEASSKSLKKKWQNLRDDNIVSRDGIFLKDYLFSSPSTAAAMILGRNANGLTEWKDSNKKTLKSILTNL